MDQYPNIPSELQPLSPWAYFGYSLLFSIPIIGLIFLIIFSFNNDNINRRNFARSFFCSLLLFVIVTVWLATMAGATGAFYYFKNF